MRHVTGYPLEIIDLQSFEVSVDADILSVTYDPTARRPMCWVRESKDATRKRTVLIYMVGPYGVVPPGCHFIGTVQSLSQRITLHFFEGSRG